ncbi:MAG: Vitamin B12 dependent methionine synthase activation subunit [Clostridiales bacterium]|nr:Vitamin B12 dependent methionine synthase activation subunit [Clostridiales bacterium]
MLLELDRKEVLRFLGYRGMQADEKTDLMIDKVYKELSDAADPKFIYKEYDFERTEDGIVIENVPFKSKKLLAHLKNSESICLFGATLGHGVDTVIRKYSLSDTALAAVAQAVGAAMTETLCNLGCEQIKTDLNAKIRPRYSPGYADLHLSSQKEFFSLLEMTKRLGVVLNDSYIMTPSKTVTAFVGIIKED